VDACLARERGIRVRDTDRPLARLIGGVLTGAKADSRYLADAHVVAAAVETGGGVAHRRPRQPRLARRALSEHHGAADVDDDLRVSEAAWMRAATRGSGRLVLVLVAPMVS
jgi:hypothetical protein